MTHIVVDWPLLLEELLLSGLTFRELATQVDAAHSTLINYRHATTSPPHATGERLIERWITITGKTRAELPMAPAVKRLSRLSA